MALAVCTVADEAEGTTLTQFCSECLPNVALQQVEGLRCLLTVRRRVLWMQCLPEPNLQWMAERQDAMRKRRTEHNVQLASRGEVQRAR